MQLNKHRVDTVIGVTDDQLTTVSVRLSDDVVISLFRETMKGFCPVCKFNKLGANRSICDECLEDEQQLLFVRVETPFQEAIEKIVQCLMPEHCIGASATEAMTHLGAYAELIGYQVHDYPGARKALVSLGAWVVVRLAKMLEEESKCK